MFYDTGSFLMLRLKSLEYLSRRHDLTRKVVYYKVEICTSASIPTIVVLSVMMRINNPIESHRELIKSAKIYTYITGK